MAWYDKTSDVHDEYQAKKHEGDISHELLSGAAAFVAAKEFEKHQEKNGKPVSHKDAKALLAGFAGAFVDHEVETRGLNYIDKEKARHKAVEHYEDELQSEYN